MSNRAFSVFVKLTMVSVFVAAMAGGCSSVSGGKTSTGGATSTTGGSTSTSGGTTSLGGTSVATGGSTSASGGTTGTTGGSTSTSGGTTSLGGTTTPSTHASGGATATGGATGTTGGSTSTFGGTTSLGGTTTATGGGNPPFCGGNPWPTADPTAAGPYKVTADKNVGPVAGAANDPVYGDTKVQFNVYRPTTLGSCHPIILWGNGHTDNPEPNPPKCLASNYCGDYLTILDQLASHGFVIIASLSTITSQPDPATGLLPQLVGMNWIVQQNEDSTSPYYHHLDVSRIGATGHSEGAFATSTIGSDPHISAIATMAGATSTPKLHEPALFLCGGQDTAVPCSTIQTAFDAVTTTPVMLEENPSASHGSWIGSPKDPYQVAVTAWMRVHLMDDTANRSMFYGANCKLCQNTQLKVQRKNMDQ